MKVISKEENKEAHWSVLLQIRTKNHVEITAITITIIITIIKIKKFMFMHQGWALKKQKIPSSSPRSLLVISSALFFVLAPGIIVRRRIKGKREFKNSRFSKIKKPLVQKKKKEKCNKNVKICYIWTWKTKKNANCT